MASQKAKKKGGFSRKQLQQLLKQSRLRAKTGITERTSGLIAIIQGEGNYDEVKMVEVKGIGEAPTFKVVKQLKMAKPFTAASYATHTMASVLVRRSTQEIMDALGIIPLKTIEKPEVFITPDIVHSVRRLVTTRAISMASEYIAAGSPGGGGSRGGGIGPGGILGTIGSSGVDVEICQSGKVSTKVTPKPARKRKAKKVNTPAEAVPTEVPSTKETQPAKEDGFTSVVKDKNGTIIVHIHFDIHIDANFVNNLNVNPQEVNSYMASEITSLKGLIAKKIEEAKVVDEVTPSDSDKEDDEEEKKKKKGKKTKK